MGVLPPFDAAQLAYPSNHFAVLGLAPHNAISKEVIKAANRLSLGNHPNKVDAAAHPTANANMNFAAMAKDAFRTEEGMALVSRVQHWCREAKTIRNFEYTWLELKMQVIPEEARKIAPTGGATAYGHGIRSGCQGACPSIDFQQSSEWFPGPSAPGIENGRVLVQVLHPSSMGPLLLKPQNLVFLVGFWGLLSKRECSWCRHGC